MLERTLGRLSRITNDHELARGGHDRALACDLTSCSSYVRASKRRFLNFAFK